MLNFMTTKVLKETSKTTVRVRGSFGEKLIKTEKKTQLTERELIDLILNVLDTSGGIETKDRKRGFKTFPQCFVASELVTMLVKYLNCERDLATQLIQKEFLEKFSVIRQVNDEPEFKDDNSFYEKIDTFIEKIELKRLKEGSLHFEKKQKQILYCILFSDCSLVISEGKGGKSKKVLTSIESVFKNVEANGFSVCWDDGKSTQVSRLIADTEEDADGWITILQEVSKK
jgi:hypothetical protein